MGTEDLAGTVFLVTGATSGIGLATARELVARGGTVVMVGHRPDHDQAVVDSVKRAADVGRVEYMVADLAKQVDVRQLAADFKRQHAHLDVLINNVGAYYVRSQVTEDGFERTFALNHLNTLLLTLLLMDILEASAPARIVNVASDAHRTGPLDFDDLQSKQRFAGFRAYSRSKTAMIMATYALARRIEGTGVTVNAMHPGFVASGFLRSLGIFATLFKPIYRLIARTPEEGADTVVYLATSPEVAGISGKYFSDRQPIRSAPFTYDEEAMQRLWETSLEMIGLSEYANLGEKDSG